MNIAEIKKLEPETKIPSITGIVKNVYQQRPVQGKRGPTSVQSIQLEQGRDWVMVEFWGRDELSPFRGKEIKVSSDRGLLIKDNSYESKKTGQMVHGVKVSCNESAIITSPGWGTPDDPEEPSFGGTGAETVSYTPPAPPPAEPRHAGPDERFVKERLNKFANLYLHCIKAADYVDATMGDSLTPEHKQAAVATLFIQATREGLQDRIAGGKFHQVEQATPPPQKAPEPPRTPPPPPQRQAPNEPPDGQAFHPSDDDPSDLPF